MKKIGPIIVMVSGVFNLCLSFVCLLILYNVIKIEKIPGGSFVQKFITNELIKEGKALKITHFIISGLALFQIMLAIGVWKKPRGFSAFFVLAVIALQLGFAIFNGVKSSDFTISNIIRLSILGIAGMGITYGFIMGN